MNIFIFYANIVVNKLAMFFLNIRIDNLSKKQVLEKIEQFLCSEKKGYKIFTPNPEMIVDSSKDKYFQEILNSSDLNICDGKGIQLFSKEKIKRIAGVDLMQDILNIAEQKNYSVYFLGSGQEKVIQDLKENIKNKYPKIIIAGANKGPKLDFMFLDEKEVIQVNPEENNEIIADIIMTNPDILFVAFGHKKQEKWIDEHLRDLPNIKIVMGVGGSFDYLANKVKRAPSFLRFLGLEWFFRLIQEPKRLKRIYKALIIFPILVLKNKYAIRKN